MPRPRLVLIAQKLRGEKVLDEIELDGYQLYAVEKWILDRNSIFHLLVVYTGDPSHKIHLNLYRSSCSPFGKPKVVHNALLFLTSLAHFRYPIVLVPNGQYSDAIRQQLYVNINLLRIGSSGRTSLTLNPPTEFTKDRFQSIYHIPTSSLLSLLKLIQSALTIFGYPLPIDGLLCDQTVLAIRNWSSAFHLSSSSSILDPSIIAALFSIILSTRNKLFHLGYPVPKDPFLNNNNNNNFPTLSLHHIHSIDAAYSAKHRKPPDDSLVNPIYDLPTLVRLVSGSNSSLGSLWSKYYTEDDSDRWRAWALKRKNRRAQSPTLPPFADDDDLLTSGQVSPLPFQLDTATTKKTVVFDQASDESDPRKEQTRSNSLLNVLDSDRQIMEDDEEEDSEIYSDDEKSWNSHWEDPINKKLAVLKRRRTFHDLASFQSLIPHPLSPDRLKIDVQLCSQLLTISRRDPHLRNVLASLRLITSSLETTSTSLRTHYHHVHFAGGTTDLGARSNEIIHGVEEVNHQVTEAFSKGTNTMRYESEQFDVDAIWAATSEKREKVWELRAGVFGVHGDPQNSQRQRKLPPGVHGAHGSFNRLQWRLDGRNVLVDHLGRTESEAEEEAKIDGGDVEEASGEEVGSDMGGERTAHPGIKPMWLLKFFTSWGARWSATSGPSDVDAPAPS